jgi:hypothetical protein
MRILRTVRFLAVMLPAVALLQSGASLLALPNNGDVPAGTYFVVVHGLGWTGVVLIGAVIATALLAVLVRKRPISFWLAFVGLATITTTLVIFLRWIDPTDGFAGTWTAARADWPSLRQQWEYGYAAMAVLALMTVCAVTGCILSLRER